MENTEKTPETPTTVSAELSTEQYAFLTNWQKAHEQELGIEVPIGAMVRKAVDIAMKSQNKKEERPPRESRESRDSRPAPRPSFGAPRGKTFGGPKFSMMGPRSKSRTCDK
jgi:hypothetical protein